MTSRDAILQHVRNELGKGPQVALSAVAEVWPRENPPPAEMAERFATELTAVHGEMIRCRTIAEATRQLASLADRAHGRRSGRWIAP